MKISPYLAFPGTCEEAFAFYERALGGTITAMLPHAGTPMEKHTPPAWHSKIMHARLVAGSCELMGSDQLPEHFATPQGFNVSLAFEDTSDAERVYSALSQGGTILMELQETFWAKRFGMFTDKFGIPWLINSGEPDPS